MHLLLSFAEGHVVHVRARRTKRNAADREGDGEQIHQNIAHARVQPSSFGLLWHQPSHAMILFYLNSIEGIILRARDV